MLANLGVQQKFPMPPISGTFKMAHSSVKRILKYLYWYHYWMTKEILRHALWPSWYTNFENYNCLSHQDVTKIKGKKLCCNLFTISHLPMYAKHLVTCIFTNKMKHFYTVPSDLEINSDKKRAEVTLNELWARVG